MKKPTLTLLALLSAFSLSILGKSVRLEAKDPLREDIKVDLPRGFHKKEKWPLIISLHGYSGNSSIQNYYVRLRRFENKLGFVFAAPNGVKNEEGKRFWNGSNFCCDFDGTEVDDIQYIKDVIKRISEHKDIGRIDLDKIYLIGYSNGGFMASKIACESNLKIAGLVTMAGTSDLRDENQELLTKDEFLNCSHNRPIKFLHVHGTEDKTIPYNGLDNGKTGLVSANDHVSRWAKHNNCSDKIVKSSSRLNASNFLKGKETEVFTWENCDAPVKHFKILKSGHFGIYKKSFTKEILNFLLD